MPSLNIFDNNFGTPRYSRTARVADVAVIHASTPVFGARIRIPGVTTPVPIYSLVKADGTLAAAGETAVGVTAVELTQEDLDSNPGNVQLVVATSGNFNFEGIGLDASLTTLALAQATVAGLENIIINSHPGGAV